MAAIFENLFYTYETCKEYCDNANGIKKYPFDTWYQRQKSFVVNAQNGKNFRADNLIEFVNAKKLDDIVDFGGGAAWIFHLLQAHGCHFQHYHLVETNESIELFKDLIQGFTRFSVSNLGDLDINGFSESHSILYSNSAFQYMPNIEEVINKLIWNKKWDYILIDDLQNASAQSYWTCQRYHGFLVPYQFIKIERLLSLFRSGGYKLIKKKFYKIVTPDQWEFCIEGDNFTIFPDPSLSLLFKRIDT